MRDSAACRRSDRAPHLAGLWLSVAMAFCSVFLFSESASAYPWMLRHGYTGCQVCHADPSGGELLNTYGRIIGDSVLPTQYGEGDGSDEVGAVWGLLKTPEWLMLGGGFRNLAIFQPGETDAFRYVPVMQFDLYGHIQADRFRAGGSIGIAKVAPGSPHARAAQVTAGQGDELNLVSRTHWLGVNIGDNYVLRAGRLNLPFGMRIPEHTMWVREATFTDRESDQQHGAALAVLMDEVRAEFMLIAGNYQVNPDEFRERGYSFYVEGAPSTSVTVGVSSKATQAFIDKVTFDNTTRQAHGVFGRWAIAEPLALLYEGDLLFTTDANMGYVGFAQLDLEVVQGLHLIATGELLDEGYADDPAAAVPPPEAPGFGQPRYGVWGSVDWFFYKQLEFRVDVQARQESPLTVLGQLHFYL